MCIRDSVKGVYSYIWDYRYSWLFLSSCIQKLGNLCNFPFPLTLSVLTWCFQLKNITVFLAAFIKILVQTMKYWHRNYADTAIGNNTGIILGAQIMWWNSPAPARKNQLTYYYYPTLTCWSWTSLVCIAMWKPNNVICTSWYRRFQFTLNALVFFFFSLWEFTTHGG